MNAASQETREQKNAEKEKKKKGKKDCVSEGKK